MKIIFSCTIFFLCLANGQAQERFVKFIDTQAEVDAKIFDMFYDTSSNHVYAIIEQTDSFFRSIILQKYDTLGNLMLENNYFADTTLNFCLNEYNNIEKIGEGQFVIYSDYIFAENKQFVVWFNDSLMVTNHIILDEVPYPEIRVNFTRKIISRDNSYYLFGRKQRQSFEIDFSIIKLDSLGNKLWEKFYGDSNQSDDILNTVNKLQNGNFLLAGSSVDRFPEQDVSSKILMYEVNQEGEIIKEISNRLESEVGNFSELVTFEDNGFDRYAFASSIVTYDEFYQEYKNKIRYFTTDSDGLVIDSSSYGNSYSRHNNLNYNKKTEGGFIAAGQMINPNRENRNSIFAKFNEQTDTIWWRQPDINNNPFVMDGIFITGLQVLPSGSIMACGRLQEFPIENGPIIEKPFILKLDKYGCLEQGCHISSSTQESHNNISAKIFPNPFTSTLTIDVGSNSFLEIFDSMGQVLYSDFIKSGVNNIKLENLNAGIYYYKLFNNRSKLSGKLIKI